MFGVMQVYQMQAMEQHIAQKETRRMKSASRLLQMSLLFNQDRAKLVQKISLTLESVEAVSAFSAPRTRSL